MFVIFPLKKTKLVDYKNSCWIIFCHSSFSYKLDSIKANECDVQRQRAYI